MASQSRDVCLSEIDERRFGIRTARVDEVEADAVEQIVEYCADQDVRLLIARCTAASLSSVHAMEQHGFLLMDTLVYYSCDLMTTDIPADTGSIPVRAMRAGEAESVRAVAAGSFRGYLSHYHADERLRRDLCDEVYTSWTYRSAVSRDVADEVLVADRDGQIVGFATLRHADHEVGEGVLFGVAPSVQRQGVYRSLMVNAMEWCVASGAQRMIVSTQITNIAVQKVWSRLGFEPNRFCYTFHKWFDLAGMPQV